MHIETFYAPQQQQSDSLNLTNKGGKHGEAKGYTPAEGNAVQGAKFTEVMALQMLQQGLISEEGLFTVEAAPTVTQNIIPTIELVDSTTQTSVDTLIAQLAMLDKAVSKQQLKDGGEETSDFTIKAMDLTQGDPAKITDLVLIDGTDLGTGEDLAEQIDALIKAAEDQGLPGILFNLTPQQMTQLQKDISAGNITQPPAGFSLVMITPANGDMQAFQNRLNDLMGKSSADDYLELLNIKSPEEKFSALLKNAAAKNTATQEQAAQNLGAQKNADNAVASALPEVTANVPFSAIEGIPFTDGAMLAALGWDNDTLSQMGITSGSQMPGSLTNLTHLATQARGAGYAHPGTALVAATLSQVASKGDTRAITLQMDPPELGRVEVRMEVGKDKTVKATILSEKPESHLMLQRDASTLERLLQDAGLDVGGDSLSFELAQDNQDFNQDGRHDGSRNGSKSGENDDGELEIINATMSWFVDPESGHTHYSILV